MNELSEQNLTDLDDVELLHRVDEIVTQFDELDPQEAGEALGVLVQEFGERHSPDAVLAQFRRLLLERDPDADLELALGAIRDGNGAPGGAEAGDFAGLAREGVQSGRAGLRERQRVEGFEGDVRSPERVRSIGCLDHLYDLESECG